MPLLILLLLLTFAPAFSQDQWKDVYGESAWQDRDRWQKADELIRHLGIKAGSQVADIGCHEGYLSVKLAAAVGKSGTVYAVDVEQPKLDRLKTNLEKRQLQNVKSVKGDYDDPKLPQGTLDAVIILDTYHEMDDHDEILRHVLESLRPGGRLVICDPIAETRRDKTRDEQERRHELGMNFAKDDLVKAGFELILEKDPFVDRKKEKGDTMWLLVARKKS